MKVSYKTIKRFLDLGKTSEDLAKDLVMHTAEVEEIHSQKKDFENIVYWKIKKLDSHPDADSLKICMVDVWEKEDVQIVCGGTNLKVWQAVAVAKIWASVFWHWDTELTVMKKTSIRWVESFGMICASEEIWLDKEFPAETSKEILDFGSLEVKTWTNLAEVLNKDDEFLEIDNKAINHRPDMFSHIWIIRELAVINWKKFDYKYEKKDFSHLKSLEIKNEIPDLVKRYIGLEVSNVSNIESPDYIKEILKSQNIESKWILIDVTNYSLYFYGQPTHCFDADKISWKIVIRMAKNWEKFLALNDKEYELTNEDIVISDSEKVIALGWVIGWKLSAVTNQTKNIVIEWAHFEQAFVRKTWKRHWVRTDSLNVFEKDLLPEMALAWVSLIVSELEKVFSNMTLEAYSDLYEDKQVEKIIKYDLNFIKNLIWKNYEEKEVLEILENLWIEKIWDNLKIPFWRKDLEYKADIAEEIARITWYDKVESTPSKINTGAVIQDTIYRIKNDSKEFFTSIGFYDMYNYSFVNEDLMKDLAWNTDNLVSLKNPLSSELSHMKWDLIPNLMLSLKENIRDEKDLRLFEFEKVFNLGKKSSEIIENYELSWVIVKNEKIVYYDIQNIVSNLLKRLWLDNFYYETCENKLSYAHSWRTSKIIARWNEIWFVWEIHPQIAEKFDVKERIGFFKINVSELEKVVYNTVKASEVSSFQMNNFDLSFVVDKNTKWRTIKTLIEWVNKNLIKKVELFDIFEDKEKLWDKRSLSFKIYIQSLEWTLDDNVKNSLINEIVEKAKKKWAELR